MNRLLVIGGAIVGAALIARRFAPTLGGHIDWEQRIAAMPDSAPPKWMFTNITAIRENTERILEKLEEGTPAPGEEPREPAAR